MSKKSISILYLSFGSGHQVAAESLAGSLRSIAPEIRVIAEDPFSKSIEVLPSVLAGLSAATIVLAPTLYEFAWRRPPADHNRMENLGLLQNFLLEELKNHDSDVIVCTQVVPCGLVSGLKKSGRLSKSTKIYGVVTDYCLNSIWPLDHMDGYFVAHEELRRAFIYRGADPDTIHVTGIPIKPAFNGQSLSPTSNCLRVLMIAGGMRHGAYVMLQKYATQVLRSLNALNATGLKVTIVTGNQTRLKQDLERLADKCPYELEIKGYVGNMEELMAANDILIAKPGGLTIAEALASGIPLITSQPAPGVENANVEFLARHGVALRGETAAEVVRSLQFCMENPRVIAEMKSAARKLGFPNSAEVIARRLLDA